jgi:hypothetical protein
MNYATTNLLNAFLPDPVRVLGVPLRPLSLGSVLILRKLANRFIIGGPADLGDLLTGIFVCSRPMEEAKAGLASGEAMRWSKQLAGRVAKASPAQAFEIFKQYITDGMAMPKYWSIGEDAPHQWAADEMAHLICFARQMLGMTGDEIFNGSLLALKYQTLTMLERQGAIRFWSEEDEERKRWEDEFAAGHPEIFGSAKS